jgi:hypothetical protein
MLDGFLMELIIDINDWLKMDIEETIYNGKGYGYGAGYGDGSGYGHGNGCGRDEYGNGNGCGDII